MSALAVYRERTFAALSVRNYRLYFIGQGISQSGSWMQSVAQGLLVLELTGSGTALGLVIAVQTVPILLFGPWGGLVADRFPKRRILYVTQSLYAVLALALGLLVVGDGVRLWMVYAVGLLGGLVTIFDLPARQTFVREMVGPANLANAVTLGSVEFNLARVIGPALAGVLAATVGLGACFVVGGLSYLPVLLSLAMMRAGELRPSIRVTTAKGQIREGLRYVRTSPVLLNTLVMMAIIGMFTYEFSVMLPLFSEFTLGAGEAGYAAMTAAMGAGAVVGGLTTAGRGTPTPRAVAIAAALFGGSVALTALAPTLVVAVLAMTVVGYFSIALTSMANVTMQLNSRPEMQGRVMALWSMAFLGTTPIGGPLMGAIGQHAGPRVALGIAGAAAVFAAGLLARATRRGEAAT